MAELARRAWGPSTIVDFQDYGKGDSDVSFGARTMLRDVGRRTGPIKAKLNMYDVVLDTGAGDSFTDIYGFKRLTTMIYAQRAAQRRGIPVAMGPQTIGPFNTVLGRAAARRTLRKMTSVQARDSSSSNYSRSLGRAVDCLATDVVFALPRVEAVKSRDVLVNVSGLLWFSDTHVDSAKYRRSVRSLVESLRDAGRQVGLLAHVINRESVVDDLAAIRDLQTQVGNDLEVLVPKSLDDVRGQVSSAELVIGSRMHACLNALSTGTPAIPWAYSRKFAPLMNDIGWEHGFDLKSHDDPARATMELISTTDPAVFRTQVSSVLSITDARLDESVESLRSMMAAV